jgi:hypothetical protein
VPALSAAVLILALAQPPAADAEPPDPATLGPRVGDALPAFTARDQDGRLRDFASLAGSNGLVLLFFRSADW